MGDEDSRAPRKDPGLGRPSRGRSEAGFDRWIVDQLRKLYDEVLDEEVPEDLVKAVRSFDGRQEEEPDPDREHHEDVQPGPGRARG